MGCIETYRFAIGQLARVLDRQPLVSDLTPETITALNRAGIHQKSTTRRYLKRLWRYAAQIGIARRWQPAPAHPKLPEPEGEPGTVVHFFQSEFKPQTLLRCGHSHYTNYLTTLRKLRACFGRDLLLSELSPATLAKFVTWLSASAAPGRIKIFRTNLLTVWQYAHDVGQAPEVCRVRPIKISREEPDAWSEREVARIIEAAGQLRRPPICGVPANQFWPAMLLIGWYTGLRRRALFAIETANVDLQAATVYIPADGMKNCVGKRFRIGADAVAAVRVIYDRSRPLLFPSPRGELMRCYGQHFDEILAVARIPASRLGNCHFHKLRRTTATHVAAAAGLAVASALLGHSGPELLKRYIDPTYTVGNDVTQLLPVLGTAKGGSRG